MEVEIWEGWDQEFIDEVGVMEGNADEGNEVFFDKK